ncbi:MAG: thiamine pyrophosphate-dependent dehydrogenase E1 component subunit alpha, partial [bacterium]
SLGGGFALKYENKPNVSVAFFGDGALNQGVLYEAMNMAALWDLPVMFAVINNQYGMGTRVDRASACTRFAERADTFGVRGAEVDGMDVEKVLETANELFEHSRSGKGPTFLVAECYRFYGHGRKDPSPYRSKDEEAAWKEKDPVEAYVRRLIEDSVLTREEVDAMRADIGKEVEEAMEFAKESPVPERDELFEHVYVDDWS